MNNTKEIIKKLAFKWVTIPLTFAVVCCSGAIDNLPKQFDLKKADNILLKDYGTLAVYLGAYSGIIGGLFVDKLPNTVSFIVAAVFALISFIPLAFLTEATGTGIMVVILLLFFIAGLASSISVLTAVVSLVKNFDAGRSAIILVGLSLCYLRLCANMDESFHNGFLKDASKQIYLIIVGSIIFVTFIVNAFAMTKVELGKILDTVSENADPSGVFTYVLVTGLLLVTYFVLEIVLQIHVAAASVFVFFLFLNFLALALAIFLIYKKVKSGGGVSLGGLTKKPIEDQTPGQMFGKVKFIMILLLCFTTLGVSYAFEELMTLIGLEAEALPTIKGAQSTFWFADVFGRFLGGLLLYFLGEKISGYKFNIVYAILVFIGSCGVFAILSLDLNGSFWFMIPPIFMGFGCGGIWAVIPCIILGDGGYKNLGTNVGIAILFAGLGICIFGFILELSGKLGILAGILFLIFSIIGIVAAVIANSDHAKGAPASKAPAAKPAASPKK